MVRLQEILRGDENAPAKRSDCSFPSWWTDENLLVMINVGVDESKSDSSSLLVLSAIVGNTAQMRKMDRSWKHDLNTSGVDYFHAKDHWNASARSYHGISRSHTLPTDLILGYRHLWMKRNIREKRRNDFEANMVHLMVSHFR